MQLSFDAADRLVELVEARRGPVPADEAARVLFALSSAPAALARSLLDDVVTGDARLAWRGASVGLAAPPGADVAPRARALRRRRPRDDRALAAHVADLRDRRAARPRLELEDAFETLVDPRAPLPPAVTSLTGIRQDALRGAPRAELAVRRLPRVHGRRRRSSPTTRASTSAFLDREVERLTGKRIAAPVVDTVWLARRLLGERTRRVGLAALAHFFGVPTEPCHRALPDARATAEILLVLIGLAQERGARTLADLVELAAPRARRLHDEALARRGRAAAPGRLRLPRTRRAHALRRSRPRPARAPALVLRRRSPASGGRGGARGARAGRVDGGRLRARGGARGAPAAPRAAAARERTQHAPRSPRLPAPPRRALDRELRADAARAARRPQRSRAAAARALDGHESDDVDAALPVLRGAAPPARAGAALRGRGPAARPDRRRSRRRRRALRELERMRALEACVVVPAREAGFVRAHAIAAGARRRGAARAPRPRCRARGRGARRRGGAGGAVARHRRTPTSSASSRRSSGGRRPSSASAPLDAAAICALVQGLPLAA